MSHVFSNGVRTLCPVSDGHFLQPCSPHPGLHHLLCASIILISFSCVQETCPVHLFNMDFVSCDCVELMVYKPRATAAFAYGCFSPVIVILVHSGYCSCTHSFRSNGAYRDFVDKKFFSHSYRISLLLKRVKRSKKSPFSVVSLAVTFIP